MAKRLSKRIINRRKSAVARPIVDIGFGSGHSLFKTALRNPTRKFVGIEVIKPNSESRLRRTIDDVANGKMPENLKIYFLDKGAVDELKKMRDNSVAVFNMDYVF